MKYDRFTRKTINGNYTTRCEDCKYADECEGYDIDCEDLLVRELGELEDKIENGTLVELPCKVGTTIYHLYKAGNVITEDKVFNYHFEICTKPCVSFENHFWFGTNKRVDTILVEQFGKYWFLTKAEAEAKLKELKGEV